MIVNDRLVYLRLQKCASTMISGLLVEAVGGERLAPSHRRLDFDADGRLVFASLRDPWSWYVSVFAFACEGKGLANRLTGSQPRRRAVARVVAAELRARRSPLPALRVYAANRARPAPLYQRLLRDADDVGAFREWLALVHDPRRAGDLAPGYSRASMHEVAGFYTYKYLHLLARDARPISHTGAWVEVDELVAFDREQNVCDAFVRLDRLEPDLLSVLERAGYDLTDGLRAQIATACRDARNRSRHRPVTDYYDAAAIALVRRRDALIVDKHDFAMPAVALGG